MSPSGGLAVRPLTVSDMKEARAILSEAYGAAPGRGDELLRYLDLQPDGWLLASLDGHPVGMGGAVDYGRCAYLGMMAVLPAVQRRGVGRAVLERVLAWLDARGCTTVLLDATAAGAGLYVQHGFEEAGTTLLLRRAGGDVPLRRSGVALLDPADLPAVAALDQVLYGARRDRLLASYLAGYAGRLLVARDAGGQIAGYLVAQNAMVGPWAALSPDSAEALLTAALALPFDGAPGVIVPRSNAVAVDLLLRYGFRVQRELRHMRRGQPWPVRTILYGQASFAVG